jgi:predicted GNAT family acetyltransferase
MEIVPLNPVFEPVFWKHVNRDTPHYFFFALDWKNSRDETEILLAVTGKRIDGMMLVYKKRIVQFRGKREAARMLLEHLDLEKVELQALKEHKQYILEKYEPTWSHELKLMVLHKGEEKLHTVHQIVKLDASDAEQIAAIMNKADPEFWGEVTTDQVAESMSSTNWIGIKLKGELASICRTRITEQVGHIVTVATHEAHRNKGYATSLVSHSVNSILNKTSTAIIYVLNDNQPAIRAYNKVGFKPYKTYYFIKGKKR